MASSVLMCSPVDAMEPARIPGVERARGSRRAVAALSLLALVILAVIVAGLWPAPAEPGPESRLVRVLELVDGDTIRVAYAGRSEAVRYIGMDTPETRHPVKGEQPGGREASEGNRRLVAGKWVRLEFDVQTRDRYGRLLAYVWIKQDDGSELMVNAELVRLGYAQVMTIPPNVRYAALLRELQGQARAAGRGLWSGSSLRTPSG